jgi:hypothetical protein
VTALNSAEGLSDDQREGYGRALARVVRSMPKAALDRIDRHLTETSFYPSTAAIGPAMIDAIATAPGVTPEDGEKRRADFAWLATENVGGAYMHWSDGSARLFLDGDQELQSVTGRYSPGRVQLAHRLHAHELGHAIDGPKKELSGSAEWQEAYRAEIEHTPADVAAKKEPKLTRYAGSKPSEGWAEFSAIVHGSDVPHSQIARDFPKATAVWKARGLWPETERTGPESKLPEVFEKRAEIGTDGAHADVLLKGGAK